MVHPYCSEFTGVFQLIVYYLDLLDNELMSKKGGVEKNGFNCFRIAKRSNGL